jgi:hypothetical protein
MTDEYVSRRAAERIVAQNAALVAKIERDMVARIVARVSAGDNSQVATAEEARRALSELQAAAAALEQALDALPGYPAPPEK